MEMPYRRKDWKKDLHHKCGYCMFRMSGKIKEKKKDRKKEKIKRERKRVRKGIYIEALQGSSVM